MNQPQRPGEHSAAKPQPKRLTTKARRHQGLSSGSLPAVREANSTLKKCKKQNLILHSFLTFCFLHFFRVILRAGNDPDLCVFVVKFIAQKNNKMTVSTAKN